MTFTLICLNYLQCQKEMYGETDVIMLSNIWYENRDKPQQLEHAEQYMQHMSQVAAWFDVYCLCVTVYLWVLSLLPVQQNCTLLNDKNDDR